MAIIHDALELARWAPSGDNTQPWRFEIVSDTSALIHAYDTRTHCVYDLDGHASEVAHGALLETIAIAATLFGMRATDRIVGEHGSRHAVYRVDLVVDRNVSEDPLAAFIRSRSVERRPMKTAPLRGDQLQALADSVPGYTVRFATTRPQRLQMAVLNARNAYIRLTIPEAFTVHKAVIAWHTQTSEDRLPDASLGASPMLLATMRFAMASFERVDVLNRFAGGTLLPRLALDLAPGIRCAAHFALIAPSEPGAPSDYVRAGRAAQRLWLTAERVGLRMQPSYTPLVFARYAREGRSFTGSSRAMARAQEIATRLDALYGVEQARKIMFLGRVGIGRSAIAARSLRRPLEQLLVTSAPVSLA